MANYLGIIRYISIDQDGRNPLQRTLLEKFEDDSGSPEIKFDKLIRDRLNGVFVENIPETELYEIARKIK